MTKTIGGQVRLGTWGRLMADQLSQNNDWEEVKQKSDAKIKEWIDTQMAMRSCLVVLIGATTSGRKWIDYEIKKAYELNKGIVGIHIHNLKDKNGNQTTKGSNPFYHIYIGKKMNVYQNMLPVLILPTNPVNTYTMISMKTLNS